MKLKIVINFGASRLQTSRESGSRNIKAEDDQILCQYLHVRTTCS